MGAGVFAAAEMYVGISLDGNEPDRNTAVRYTGALALRPPRPPMIMAVAFQRCWFPSPPATFNMPEGMRCDIR